MSFATDDYFFYVPCTSLACLIVGTHRMRGSMPHAASRLPGRARSLYGLLHVNDYMYNVEGKCNVWKPVGEGPDLLCNETEIMPEKKRVRYAVVTHGPLT